MFQNTSKIKILFLGKNMGLAEKISTMTKRDLKYSEFNHSSSLADASDKFLNAKNRPDIIFLCHDIEDFNNFHALKTIRLLDDQTPVILLCDMKNRFLGFESVTRGADNYLVTDKLSYSSFRKIFNSAIKSYSCIKYIKEYTS